MRKDIFDLLGQRLGRAFATLDQNMDTAFENFDTAFESMDASFSQTTTTLGGLNYRVEKSKGLVLIIVEVPGCSQDDVKVALADGNVSVTAKAQTKQFRVGTSVKLSDIKASVKHGLLTIRVVKAVQPESPQGVVPITKD